MLSFYTPSAAWGRTKYLVTANSQLRVHLGKAAAESGSHPSQTTGNAVILAKIDIPTNTLQFLPSLSHQEFSGSVKRQSGHPNAIFGVVAPATGMERVRTRNMGQSI